MERLQNGFPSKSLQQLHLKGLYQGQPAECIAEIDAIMRSHDIIKDQTTAWERAHSADKASCSGKGSSLDPACRRPKVSLKRKRERNRDSHPVRSRRARKDIFSEQVQVRHISRSKCPGLLARYALEEARKRLLMGLGEVDQQAGPRAVFVKVCSRGVCPIGSVSSYETRVPHSCHVPRFYRRRKHFEMP